MIGMYQAVAGRVKGKEAAHNALCEVITDKCPLTLAEEKLVQVMITGCLKIQVVTTLQDSERRLVDT